MLEFAVNQAPFGMHNNVFNIMRTLNFFASTAKKKPSAAGQDAPRKYVPSNSM
jgi:hypothetical protein